MVLDAMSELVAVSIASSGVRDSGSKRRKGDDQDLGSVSYAPDAVGGVLFVYHEEGHVCGRRGERKDFGERKYMVCGKEWMRSVKEGGTCSGRNGVASVS